MPREFSVDFANRLGVANIQYVCEIGEFFEVFGPFSRELRAMVDQFRKIMDLYVRSCRTIQCLVANGTREEIKRYIGYHNELEHIADEEGSKFHRNAEPHLRLLESKISSRAVRKRSDILKKIELTMGVIKELIADEEVSVQRTETKNASDKTDGESTTVQVAERKISSEVDDGGSTAGTMEKVEEGLAHIEIFSAMHRNVRKLLGYPEEASDKTDGESTTVEVAERKIRSEVDRSQLVEVIGQFEKCWAKIGHVEKCIGLPEEASDEADGESTTVEVAERKLSSEVDRTQLVEGLEKCFAMLEHAAEFMVLPEETSDKTDGELTTIEVAERKISSEVNDGGSTAGTMANLEFLTDGILTTSKKQSSEILPRQSSEEEKCVGFPEEASYTDEKSKERLEKLSFHFRELVALFHELETVKKECLEL